MKKIDKSRLFNSKLVGFVHNERAILEQLDHPFIVRLHSSFQTGKCLYFVMQLAEGGDLFALLHRKGPLSESQARFYISEVFLALEYLHSRGIAHGDLKLENILLGADGHVLLSDFGLARGKNGTPSLQSTPEYMSPEQLRGEDCRFAADFWALVR